MEVGEYKKLRPNQKRWLEWLLGDGWGWTTIHINAPNNHERLKWAYHTGIYDEGTKPLLNFLLNRFNENEVAKKDWIIYNKWKIKTNEDLEM
jgi:hypothetical protein